MKRFLLLLTITLSLSYSQTLKVQRGKNKYVMLLTSGAQTYKYHHHHTGTYLYSVKKGNLIAYAFDMNLCILDIQKKQIIKRILMPMKINQMEWESKSTLNVQVIWHETYIYKININKDNNLPGSNALLGYRFDEADVGNKIEKFGLYLPFLREKQNIKMRPKLLKKKLLELGNFDITNPWVDFYKGFYEFKLGSKKKANTIWNTIPDKYAPNWHNIFKMGIYFHLFGERELGKKFHTLGMKQLYSHGFEPRMEYILIFLMFHKGGLAKEIQRLREKGKWKEASDLLNEYYELTPRCEMFSPAMLTFAKELKQTGKPHLAKMWKERAQDGIPFQYFGGMSIDMLVMGLTRSLFLVICCVILIFPIAMLIKNPYVHLIFNGTFSYRLLNRTTLLSIFFTAILGIFCIVIQLAGQNALEISASTPIGTLGNLSHPEALRWISTAEESEAKHFYLGMVYQARKDYALAIKHYGQAQKYAQTFNNLALIDIAKGKDPTKNFQKALSINPKLPEALWNMKKEAIGWAKIHKKYSKDPMIAAPTGEMHKEFLMPSIYNAYKIQSERRSGFMYIGEHYIMDLLFVATLLSFLAMFRSYPKKEQREDSAIKWIVCILPGTSKYWNILGAFMASLWFLSISLVMMQYNNPSEIPILSDIGNIAIPLVKKAFGISGVIPDMEARLRILFWAKILAIVLPCVNILLFIVEGKRENDFLKGSA